MPDTSTPGYRAIAEILERIEGRQQTMGRQVEAIDTALRGSLEADEIGLIARVGITENAVVRIQHDHARLAEEVKRPGDERRQDARAIVTGGLAAVFGALITWVAVHVIGK